jgi:hypothetical protein
MKRVLPAIGLFFIAPLVAEFLLGNIPITMLGAMVLLAPMYGGGALLIRELVRRTGRGWPSILLLGLAYGILEEAYMTQSLFNPDYLNLNMGLLKPAYISALAIGGWWTIFVLTLHTVWSISVSIGLTESLVPNRATTPWLKGTGLTITTILFAAAAIGAGRFAIKTDKHHFVASTPQFAWAGVVCAVIIAIAFLLPRRSAVPAQTSGSAPSPWLVGALALIAASIFMVVPNAWAWKAVGIYIVLYLIMIAAVYVWSHRAGWDGRHRLGLAAGAALAYGWHAFIENPAVGKTGRVGNAVFALALIVLLAIAARKNVRNPAENRAVATKV